MFSVQTRSAVFAINSAFGIFRFTIFTNHYYITSEAHSIILGFHCQYLLKNKLLIYNRFVKKQAYFYFVRDLSPEKVGLLQQTHFYL